MTKKKKSPSGNGKFQQWITEEGLLKLQGWARDGLTNIQIAHNCGVTENTFYRWQRSYPEIAEAVAKGKEVIDIQVENALLKRALGYEAEETKTYAKKDKGGNTQTHVEKIKKHIPGDTTAMIFWLKNRKAKEWNEKYHLEHEGTTTTNVNVLNKLSEDDLIRLANMNKEDD